MCARARHPAVLHTHAHTQSIKLRDDDKTVASYGVKGGMKLVFKDLGPQIGYRTVFIIEYLGPIIIMLLYAMRPSILYGAPAALAEWNWVATWGVAAWILHFVKRELVRHAPAPAAAPACALSFHRLAHTLYPTPAPHTPTPQETLFVHKFSLPTMPLSNLFKNSAYYWGFALAVGYPLCHPDYTAPDSLLQVQVGAALMACAELANLLVHLQLSGMRKVEGSKERAVPGGPLFALVSCPNYTAEILSWVGFSIMTQIAFSYAFTVVGFLQMSEWALKKHRNYITSSNGEYKKLGRKAIVPFLL